jgi:hypothetical protein
MLNVVMLSVVAPSTVYRISDAGRMEEPGHNHRSVCDDGRLRHFNQRKHFLHSKRIQSRVTILHNVFTSARQNKLWPVANAIKLCTSVIYECF